MTARFVVLLALVAAAWPFENRRALRTLQQQTFRTTTDLVMVDVSVRSGDRAVQNLTAADFILTDNGVRQKIESVEPTAVPIDVTVVVDLSGNYRRPRGARMQRAKVIGDVTEEVGQVAEILRPTDRVRLLVIDRYVRQVWPFLPVVELPAITSLEFDGLASVYEGLAAALLQPVEPARRHVIIARTKGTDTFSSITAQAVGSIASRSDALFHVVIMEEAKNQEAAMASFQCVWGFCWPTNRGWMPTTRRELIGRLQTQVRGAPPNDILPDGEAIKTGVEATGGAWHQTEMLSMPSLAGTFRAAFEDFRTGYVLRYTPQGVTRGGWHRLDVALAKPQGFRVRARRGYGIDEAPPAPPPPSVPAVPRTLDELTLAYEHSAFQNVAAGLRQATDPVRLIRAFKEAGNPWPATPRREAAFAVELAEAGLFAPGEDARKEAGALLREFARLVRHPLGPSDFERQWYLAVVTLMQGTLSPPEARPLVDRALERFPSDPQFLLARAIVSEQTLLQTGGRAGAAKPGPPSDARAATRPTYEEVRRYYDAAIAAPAVATEARIRLAHRLHLGRQSKEALALLDATQVETIQTPNLAYLRELFRGHALGALGRTDEAMAAYREALTIVPPGQAARVSLMRHLLERGSASDAEALADLVQTERSPALDPWWLYWQGQYRLYPQAIARLRELSR
jgi:tetratricopeptide (TPR) repeat protein